MAEIYHKIKQPLKFHTLKFLVIVLILLLTGLVPTAGFTLF